MWHPWLTHPHRLLSPHSPSRHLKCCSGWRDVVQAWAAAHKISQLPPPSPHLLSQGRHVEWEVGLGQITLPLGPLHSADVSLGGGGRRRWALSDCHGEVVPLCRTHEVLISVCMKKRGQISGSQREAGGRGGRRGGTGWFPPVPTVYAHRGCAGFGPLKSVSRCKVRTKGAGLSVAANKFTLNLCGRD